MTADLNAIIDSLAPITEYDLDGVEPTFHPIGALSNVMRDDEVRGRLHPGRGAGERAQAAGRQLPHPVHPGGRGRSLMAAAPGSAQWAFARFRRGSRRQGLLGAPRSPAARFAAHRRGRRGGACLPRNHRGSSRSTRRLASTPPSPPGRLAEMGPLAGVPVGYKDNLNLTGTHTTCSSNMLRELRVPLHGHLRGSARMRSRRLFRIGKLNMDEFAFGGSTETTAFGPTCNPWDVDARARRQRRAAAPRPWRRACAGHARVGHGRLHPPAGLASAALVAVKPTYGVVSRYGVVAFGSSLDQVGPFARSVEDAALALNAHRRPRRAGLHEPGRRARRLHGEPRRGRARHAHRRGARVHGGGQGLTPEVQGQGGGGRRALCARWAPSSWRWSCPHAQAAMSAYYVLGPCEAFSNLARFDSVRYGYCDPGPHGPGQPVRGQPRRRASAPRRAAASCSAATSLSAGVYDRYYYPAQQVRTLITQDYARAYEQVDCILAPVSPRTAFKFGEVSDPTDMYLSDMFTISINIAGNGGLSLPRRPRRRHAPAGGRAAHRASLQGQEHVPRGGGAWSTHYGPAPVAPDFADGKVGA